MVLTDWVLIVVACFTSMIAAVGGIGGGVVLIAIMPGLLPAAAIIPVHGLVQIASNMSRALLGIRHTEWRIVGQYAGGAVIGALLGSYFVADLEWEMMPLFLGIFILTITWMPKFSNAPDLPAKFTLLGAFQTALSLFFGVSGPLNMPFLLRENLPRDRTVITHSIQMASSHMMKVLTFGFLGFAFAPHWKLVVAMVISASVGSYVGTGIRGRVPERWFRIFLKGLVSLLSVRMILHVVLSEWF